MSDFSAEQLFERCADGDSAAWDEFRARYGALIKGTICREAAKHRMHISDDLADLEQSFYVKLLDRNRHVLRSFIWQGENSDFRYLKTVTRYYVKDKMAAQRPLVPLPETDIPGPQCDPVSEIDFDKMTAFVRAEFSERDYRIFRLRYFVGLTARQITGFSSIGLKESGVEVVIRKVIASLRDHFNNRGGRA